jgi:hypothetical protein
MVFEKTKIKDLVEKIYKCVQEALANHTKRKNEEDTAKRAKKYAAKKAAKKAKKSKKKTTESPITPPPVMRPRSHSDSQIIMLNRPAMITKQPASPVLEKVFQHILNTDSLSSSKDVHDYLTKKVLVSAVHASDWIAYVCSHYNDQPRKRKVTDLEYDQKIAEMILFPLCRYGIHDENQNGLQLVNTIYDKYEAPKGVVLVIGLPTRDYTDKNFYREFRNVIDKPLMMCAVLRNTTVPFSETLGTGFLCFPCIESMIDFFHSSKVYHASPDRFSIVLPGMYVDQYKATFWGRNAKDFVDWIKSRSQWFGDSLLSHQSHPTHREEGERIYFKILAIFNEKPLDYTLADLPIPKSRIDREKLSGYITGMILEGNLTGDEKFIMSLSRSWLVKMIREAFELLEEDPSIWKQLFQQQQQFNFTQQMGNRLTYKQLNDREKIAREVEDMLQDFSFIKSKEVELGIYRVGSSRMRLETEQSDIDFQVTTGILQLNPSEVLGILHDIKTYLEEHLKIDIHLIATARVPILTFKYKDMSFDISIAQSSTDSRQVTKKLNGTMFRINEKIRVQKKQTNIAHRLVIALKKFYQENHSEALNTRERGLPSIVLTIMVLAYLQLEIERKNFPSSLVDAIHGFMKFYRKFDNTKFLIDSNFSFQPIPEKDRYRYRSSSLIVQDPLKRLFNKYSIINMAQSVDFKMLRGLGIFDYRPKK